jgi:hypothetical protein
MTNPLYDELAVVSADLLEEFGQVVTLRNNAPGTYDPDTGGMTGGGPVDVARKAALFDFRAGQENGPGGLILVGDKKLLMEKGIVPGLEDLIILADGAVYVIKGIGETNPAGTVVLYMLHLRK